MNERIKVLAEQANKYSLSNVNRDSEFFHTIAMAKFAELIVTECIDSIRQEPTRIEQISGQSFKYIKLGDTIATIQEHFGVEE